MRKLWWGDYRTVDFERVDPEAVIAVVPVAAIEQHGPHLPGATYTTIMQGMIDTVLPLVPDDLDVRFLPVQAVGKSNEHLHAPGTLTLPAPVLIEAWTELGLSVARAGVRKIVFVNSHGGNEEIMGIVARELRVKAGMLAVKTSWQRFGRPAGMYTEEEERFGIHGGDVETSLMLHFRPDLVRMEEARNFRSATSRADETFALLKPQGAHAFAWIASDINPAGVAGDASIATERKGRATAAHQAAGFVDLLRDVRAARLDDWLA